MNKFLASLALGLLTSLAAQSAEQIERPFTTAYRYNLQGLLTGTISPDPDGSGPLRYLATRTTYERGLVAKVESGELQSWVNDDVAPAHWESVSGFTRFVITEYSYDQYGRKTAERVKRGDTGETESVIQYNYDSASRVLCKAGRMNKAVFDSLPGACEQSAQGSHGPDRITRYTYDNLDQVLKEERGVDTSLVQTYVRNEYGGRLLLSQTDANGNRTELRYDSQKRLARRVFPSRALPGVVNERDYEEYTYEPTGKVKTERRRNGQTITYTYDANSRVRLKDLSDNTHSPDVYFDYYPHGANRYARFGSSAGPGIRDEVDAFGRLKSRLTNTPQATSSSGPSRILFYDYDDNGNRVSVTHPDGYRFGYAFDGLNRNCGVAESVVPTSCGSSHLMVTVTYGADGSRKAMARGSTITSYLPDGVGRLRRITQDLPGTTNDLANEFTYSPSNQIRQLTQSSINYAYSGNANRAGDYARNGLNQVTSVAGKPVKHDANGNLTADPGLSFSMTYDMENRLVGTSGSAAVTSSFKYDPSGRLSRLTVGSSTTEFLYDGSALIAEYVNGAITRLYVHGDRVDEPWVEYVGAALGTAGRRYLLSDHQGSIIGRIDSAGGSLKKLAYDSFGIPLESNEGRFGYTGQLWLRELGLFYYKARVYSPALGRFLQTDPVGYADGYNLYAYVGNDPVIGVDPTGTTGACNADDPYRVGCPTTGKPQVTSGTNGQAHAKGSISQMRKMAAKAKANGETNIKGSFNQTQTNATGGIISSAKKTDATVTSTGANGQVIVRNGEITSPSQTVSGQLSKLQGLKNLATTGAKVINVVGDLMRPVLNKITVVGPIIGPLAVSERPAPEDLGGALIWLEFMEGGRVPWVDYGDCSTATCQL